MSPLSFEFNGVVRLTRLGAGYLFFTVLIGFAALNTGNNSLYITLSFMLASLLLSGLMSKEGIKKIEVEIVQIGEAWADEPVGATLLVRNPSRIWHVKDLILIGRELDEPVYIPVLGRRSSVETRAVMRFRHRGRVSLGRIDLYTRFPFGLFTKKRRAKLSGEALVFPRLLDVSSFGRDFAVVIGDQRPTGSAGSGTDIFAFREYSRGDELRHVHWKKTAATGRWIIKQSEAEANPEVVMTFDPFMPTWADDESFERIVSEAATYARDALDRGWDVRLHVAGLVVRSTPKDRRNLFERLALVEPAFETALPRIEKGAALFTLRRATDDARTA